jgi:hypothetical protein
VGLREIADRLRSWTTSHPAAANALAWLLALVGFGVFSVSMADSIGRTGGIGYDFHAFWLAGHHLLTGQPLYSAVGIGDPGAYRYIPTFAFLMAPLSLVPELAMTWLYRGVAILCLRYLVGSWRAVGWSLLFPPVVIELLALNVTLPIAVAGRWALRGNPAASASIPAASALKYGSVMLAAFLWFRRRQTRPFLVIGIIVSAGLLGLHTALDPGAWVAFVHSLGQQARSINHAPYVGGQLLFLVPSTLGDFLLRLAIAGLLTVIAVVKGWGWLAYGAATIAVPTLWLARLAPLVAIPRLWLEEREARPTA